jgi:hypothetical protein
MPDPSLKLTRYGRRCKSRQTRPRATQPAGSGYHGRVMVAFATTAPAAGYISLDQMGWSMVRRLAGRGLAVRSGSPGPAKALARPTGDAVMVAAKRAAWSAPA